jgi:hypothetical protein
LALPTDDESADRLALRQLVEVVDLLTAARLEPFVSDRAAPGSYRLGVFAEHRAAAGDALRVSTFEVAPGPRGRSPVPLDRRASMATAPRWRVWRHHHLGGGKTVGPEHGVEIEFWADEATGRVVPDGRVGIAEFDAGPNDRQTIEIRGHALPTFNTFRDDFEANRIRFPVDVVYTWVDGSDPEWQDALRAHAGSATGLHAEAANPSRFATRDELRYSMRSLWWNADFFDHVYLVTWGHRPAWLEDHPRLTVVGHDEIFPTEHLPTFNSHAIESRLHHIEGLAEHFLYMNDDVFIGRPLDAGAFFHPNGLVKVVPSSAAIPPGEASAADAPVDAAAKNGRAVLRSLTGWGPSRKLAHTPVPLLRSAQLELEAKVVDAADRTSQARFRSPTDLSMSSFLGPYYCVATGRGVMSHLEFLYVNIAGRWAPAQLDALALDRNRDAFCLNETSMVGAREERVDRLVTEFLEAYFPKPSPFEG